MSHRAGELRRRITLQRRATAQDSYGGQSNTWSDLATLWADIAPVSGRELLAAQAISVEISHQITVRYRADLFADPKVVANCRVAYRGRIFNIHASLNEDERNQFVTLLASEGLNEG